MKPLMLTGMVLASLLAVAGLMAANGATANLVAGCDCISDACVNACGPNGSLHCCRTHDGDLRQIEQASPTTGYVVSLIGMTGFFILLGMNKREEDFY